MSSDDEASGAAAFDDAASDDAASDDAAFGDELRAAMRAHDAEAPVNLQWTPPTPDTDGSRTWLPFAAAAAVAVVVIGVVLALSGSDPNSGPVLTSNGSLTCPKSVQQPDKPDGTVPAKPIGVDGSKRLVPDKTPTTVTVCSYPGTAYIPTGQTRTVKLAGRRVLAGPLHRVADSLTLQPLLPRRLPCAAGAASGDGNDFLIGLTYGTDTLWVAAPGEGCDGATNGQFTTSSNLQSFAAAAYKAGHWVSDPPSGPLPPGQSRLCDPNGVGRLGQEKSLVPSGYATLTICDSDSKKHVTLSGRAAAPVATALNALPASRSDQGCTPHHGKLGTSYNVVARYPSGPVVLVSIMPGCSPPIDNLALQATRVGPVVGLIKAALR